MHYYNEIDPYAADWIRNLIAADLIPNGHVDTRDIRDILPSDLAGYTSCHFFAGLGGWAYALRLAGWPDDRPVWTGSCPCQPFSAAGKGAGFADERHLWPAWFWLIVQCRPVTIFGEQVDKAIDWLDLVAFDLEAEDYAFGEVVLPAAGIGAPHGRHRLWFVADSARGGRREHGVLSETACSGQDSRQLECVHIVGNTADLGHKRIGTTRRRGSGSSDASDAGLMGDPHYSGSQGWRIPAERARELLAGAPGMASGFWSACDWIYCRDGKYRPVEPGTFPLAHGISDRVGRLRAYGNAIVPQVAAEVIRAYMDLAGTPSA